MSSRSGPEEITLASPTEQHVNAPVATAMDAKLMVATDSGDVQQLKDLVNQEEQGSKMMVVVMAKHQAAASTENPRSHPHLENMDPRLLALASSGSSEKLRALLDGGDGQASSNNGTNGGLPIRRASNDDAEANKSIREGVTAEGDTALHVVAACGQGDNFFTKRREAKHLLVQQNHKWWRWHRCRRLNSAERCALLTTYGYGDADNFLDSARIIYGKAKHLLFMQNNNGDTPLHCAVRAGKSKMVACLIEELASSEGEDRVQELLRKEIKHKETVLHEAVRVGNKDIVDLLMVKNSELASFPEEGWASPMYLAIMLNQWLLQDTLYEKSHGNLSFAGPNGQNALHVAILRQRDLTKLLDWNKTCLCPQNKDLTTQRDENGSTPLHFAAERISKICQQVLDANTDALYQPDNAGFFPIHVAASVGASSNVKMFVKRCPSSASLRDAKGRTFLHVAVEHGKRKVIRSACRNLSLSWIMNMVDIDGNTALHLAIEAGGLRMFCALLGNPQVNLNLPNSRGETPLDIAKYMFPNGGIYYTQNSEVQIRWALGIAGALEGARRQDHLLEDNTNVRVKAHDESKKMEALKDSTATLCIGSVLITTVAFGATFVAPGGYVADDHDHGGSPIIARRYGFDAFIMANTLAFVFSSMATIGLMYSGSPLLNPRRRQIQLVTASYLLSVSNTSLAAAFALGAYMVLAPVTYKTAVATCVLTSLVLLYKKLDFVWTRRILLPPLCARRGLIWVLRYSAYVIMRNMLYENWPLVFIFGWAAIAKPGHIQK